MPTILLELLGFGMVIGGTVVALRAIASVRADLVARWTGCTVDPELAALQTEKRRARRARRDGDDAKSSPNDGTQAASRPEGKVAEVLRLKSFDENIAALNRRMGRRALNDEIKKREE